MWRNITAAVSGRPAPPRLPSISVRGTVATSSTLASADAELAIHGYDRRERRVATAVCVISPLNQFVYIYQIEVPAALRRRGYGLAMVNQLWKQHRLPLRPIFITPGYQPFWQAATQRGIRVEIAAAVAALPF